MPKDNGNFSADRPINHRTEDLFGTSRVADALLAEICGSSDKDSLVIALFGPWGSGKSSVKNMMIDGLGDYDDSAPIVVDFNPWQSHRDSQIVEQFFSDISLNISASATSEADKLLASKFEEYGVFLKMGSDAVGFIADALELFDVPGHTITKRIANATKHASELLEDGGKSQKLKEQNLSETKAKLSDFLSGLSRKILVFIDDIDRLSAQEITTLFQLVKANADLPNMVYVLLCQRDLVEASLESIAPKTSVGYGSKFLDKIVQVEVNIPRLSPASKERALNYMLELARSENFVAEASHDLLIDHLECYFNTMRDIKRFRNSMAVDIRMLTHRSDSKLHFGDYMLAAVFRVFEPRVFEMLSQSKDDLMAPYQSQGHCDPKELKHRLRNIANHAVRTAPISAQKSLCYIFPQIGWAFTSLDTWDSSAISLSDASRAHRAHHPEYFDKYFC